MREREKVEQRETRTFFSILVVFKRLVVTRIVQKVFVFDVKNPAAFFAEKGYSCEKGDRGKWGLKREQARKLREEGGRFGGGSEREKEVQKMVLFFFFSLSPAAVAITSSLFFFVFRSSGHS